MSPSDVFEPAEFASVFFFLFLCKKGERKKGSSECGPSMNKFLRPKQERVSQACLRAFFLSEKSTLLRVRGAMPWARIFFVYGRAAEAGNGPAADGSRATRARAAGRATRKERRVRAVRGKGKKGVFRGKDWKDVCFVLWVEAEIESQLSRS